MSGMIWLAVQVSGTNVVPTSLQKQNLITDTLLNMLASDHVFLIRLVAVDEVTLAGNQGSATMTYIMQKSSDTVAISTVGYSTVFPEPLLCQVLLITHSDVSIMLLGNSSSCSHRRDVDCHVLLRSFGSVTVYLSVYSWHASCVTTRCPANGLSRFELCRPSSWCWDRQPRQAPSSGQPSLLL